MSCPPQHTITTLTLCPALPCSGFAEEIAKAAGGKYYYLPNANDAAIAMAASSAMAAAKAGM